MYKVGGTPEQYLYLPGSLGGKGPKTEWGS